MLRVEYLVQEAAHGMATLASCEYTGLLPWAILTSAQYHITQMIFFTILAIWSDIMLSLLLLFYNFYSSGCL